MKTCKNGVKDNLDHLNGEKKAALSGLRSTQAQLINQERYRVYSTMASGMVHDFNNSLTVIQGYSDLLLENPEFMADPEMARKFIGYINQAARSAAVTVSGLRKFYRPRDTMAQKNLDLNRLVREALEMSKPRWQEQARAEGVQIKAVSELHEIPLIRGNEAELHECMTNIILNAVDAMPGGGTLTVKTCLENNEVCLEIADTGVGMSAEVKENCFIPFYTTKNATGSGLGLPIAQAIVLRHNGNISFESEKERGTVFHVRFPVVAGEPIEPQVKIEPRTGKDHDGVEQKTVKVLVVEDDPKQRELLGKYFLPVNFEVDLAADGANALEKIKKNTYDIVITDRAMPGMSGSELAREIRRAVPGVPIIMLTGFGDIMNAASEKAEEVDKVLSKPVSRAELYKAVRSLIS